jgi:hypothetical protein
MPNNRGLAASPAGRGCLRSGKAAVPYYRERTKRFRVMALRHARKLRGVTLMLQSAGNCYRSSKRRLGQCHPATGAPLLEPPG